MAAALIVATQAIHFDVPSQEGVTSLDIHVTYHYGSEKSDTPILETLIENIAEDENKTENLGT